LGKKKPEVVPFNTELFNKLHPEFNVEEEPPTPNSTFMNIVMSSVLALPDEERD
jgi:hypothetical protein